MVSLLYAQIATKMLNAGMSHLPDYENIRTLGDQYYDPSFEQNRFALTTITHDQNQVRLVQYILQASRF